jgi:TMEM175 potassium channel family protein
VIAPSEEPQDRHPDATLASSAASAGAPAASAASTIPADMDGTYDPQVEGNAAERVIFFSDAVVAIAITLLALALPVPGGFDGMTNGQLLHALGNDRDEYFPFLISFVVIANHWTVHRKIFRYVDRLDGQVIVANMGWLLMMILIPFATRMLEGDGGFGVRFTLYALIQIIASVCLLLMSSEIARAGLLRPGAPESARHPDHAASVAIIIAFLVSIPVSFFTEWAFALWASAPLLTRVLRRLPSRGRQTVSSPDRRPAAGDGS